MATTRVTIDGILCDREPVHINTIRPGDTVEINGHLRTVCGKDIKRCPDMGVSLFGDSYRLGTVPVVKATPVRAVAKFKCFANGRWIRFPTLGSAQAFCNEVQQKTGVILGIEADDGEGN